MTTKGVINPEENKQNREQKKTREQVREELQRRRQKQMEEIRERRKKQLEEKRKKLHGISPEQEFARALFLDNIMEEPQRVQTKFSLQQLHSLYLKDGGFREAMDTGDYMYCNEYLVLKTKDAFFYDDGRLFPNEQIPEFERKYCLQYVREKTPIKTTTTYFMPDGRKGTMPVTAVAIHHRCVHAVERANVAGQTGIDFLEFINISTGHGGSGGGPPEDTFGDVLSKHMYRKELNDLDLWELTGISEKTIQRYRKNESEPGIGYVVAICIALQLYPCWSEKMVELSGHTLRKNKQELAYLYLLNTEYVNGDIVKCNKFLKDCNLKPLTEKEK